MQPFRTVAFTLRIYDFFAFHYKTGVSAEAENRIYYVSVRSELKKCRFALLYACNTFSAVTYHNSEVNVLPRRYDFNYSTGGFLYGRFEKRLPARERYI